MSILAPLTAVEMQALPETHRQAYMLATDLLMQCGELWGPGSEERLAARQVTDAVILACRVNLARRAPIGGAA